MKREDEGVERDEGAEIDEEGGTWEGREEGRRKKGDETR